MSVINFPRSVTTTPRRDTRRHAPSRPAPRSSQRTRQALTVPGAGALAKVSPTRKVIAIVAVVAAVMTGCKFVEGQRQVQLHQLQQELLQQQSLYAEQVSAVSSLSTPSVVATHASSLKLVDPLSVTQVPSASLARPLGLPSFTGYAPVTSRTLR